MNNGEWKNDEEHGYISGKPNIEIFIFNFIIIIPIYKNNFIKNLIIITI